MLRMICTLTLIGLMAIPVGSQSSSPPPPEQFLISPGQAVGRVRLGMQTQEVIGVLGQPKRITRRDTSDLYAWYEQPDPNGMAVVTSKAGEVIRIWVQYDQRYRLKDGLRTGSSERDVRAVLGEPSRVSTDSSDKLLLYGWLGLFFYINLDPQYSLLNQVWQINVIPENSATAPRIWYMGFSPSVAPADSLAFRQAIAMAIDKGAVASGMAEQLGAPPKAAIGIEHPRLPGYNAAVRGVPYDLAKAKEAFGQSGWNGPVAIWVSGTGRFTETSTRIVAETLNRALGVTVEFKQAPDFDAFLKAIRAGATPIWLGTWAAAARDFGYPSFALGLANEYFLSDPNVKAATERRDAAAVEQTLLEKSLLVPILHY